MRAVYHIENNDQVRALILIIFAIHLEPMKYYKPLSSFTAKARRIRFEEIMLILMSLVLTVGACKNDDECPPNQLLGRLSLDAKSAEFLPFNNFRFMEFVDSLATDTAVFYDPVTLIRDSSWTIVENICEKDESRADQYYLSEHLTINYYDLDTARKFRIIGNISIQEDVAAKTSTATDPVLFDELKLTVHRSNPSISGAVASLSFMASSRNNDARLSTALKLKQDSFALVPMVIINDSVYTDVYEYKNRDSAIFYFKPSVGVVAFRALDNKWWNFHRKY